MVETGGGATPSRNTKILTLVALVAAGALPFALFDSQLRARLVAVALVCLVLWLFELVPAFVPTLVLWLLIPLALSPLDANYSLNTTLRWAADPVLALFFGGFALGVAADRHGVSRIGADWVVARSGGRFMLLLALTMALSAFASMWISNIAAAALMFGGLRPLLRRAELDDPFRRTLLVGTAFAANIGGMGTPVGTGPNAIAIASVSDTLRIDFLHWMIFALPLTGGLLLLAFGLLWWRIRRRPSPSWTIADHVIEESSPDDRTGRGLFFSILVACVALWLTESLHHVPAPVIALGATAALFLTGNLRAGDLARIDWSTLLLIAGGITLGRLLEASGLVEAASQVSNLPSMNPTLVMFVLCLASATLSALMSNTATVVMLVPLATALLPFPSTAIMVAVSASFGMTFVISTPQNAMAHGEGGVHTSDLFYPGIVILIVGCGLVALTGRLVLNLAGIP